MEASVKFVLTIILLFVLLISSFTLARYFYFFYFQFSGLDFNKERIKYSILKRRLKEDQATLTKLSNTITKNRNEAEYSH